jgi:tRNA (guanine37-N1)-methyltransferase
MNKQRKLSIKIITLFPQFIEYYVEAFGIIKKAIVNNLLEITPVYLRNFGLDERQTVDDRPYGGGVGMVLRPDVLLKAIRSVQKFQISNDKVQTKSKVQSSKIKQRVILLCPQGKKFVQKDAVRLAKYDELIFVSGRYEGFDERIRKFVDEEISIGDYVLMGGELPALVISEAVMRLRDGILGKLESTENESFSESDAKMSGLTKSEQLLEYPQYTKPERWEMREKGKGKRVKVLSVPKVLLTGHHKNIEDFRKKESEKRTKKRRPDLMQDSN